MRYVNYDFISPIILKNFACYVDRKANNMMKFKILKLKINSTQRFETLLELLIKNCFIHIKFFLMYAKNGEQSCTKYYQKKKKKNPLKWLAKSIKIFLKKKRKK